MTSLDAGSGAPPRLLIARILGQRCALPIEAIGSIEPGSRVEPVAGTGMAGAIGSISWRRRRLPVFDAREQPRPVVGRAPVILLEHSVAPLAVVVDAVDGLRSFDGAAEEPLPAWARGAAIRAILRDRGEPLFVVDVEALGRDVSSRGDTGAGRGPAVRAKLAPIERPATAGDGRTDGRVPDTQPDERPSEMSARRMTARRVLLGRVRCAETLHGVALDADRVVQVLPFQPPSPMPGAPAELLGWYTWRRRGVAVAGLADLLGAATSASPPRRVVVCRALVPATTTACRAEAHLRGGGALLGLALDDVLHLTPTPAGALLHPLGSAPWCRIAAGRFQLGGEPIALLDADAIASIVLGAHA